MSRVRANDYEDKRQLILDQAAALIAGRGFELATMLDLAQACGTSKSLLYHYFPHKEDLLFAIVHDHITRQAADLRRIVALPLPADQRFAQFVDSFVQGAAASRHQHLMLMNDLKHLPDAQRAQIQRLEADMTELLAGLLDEINPGVMAQRDARKPYALLLYGMMIWTFSWYRQNGPITPAELARRISALFVDGFRAQPASGQAQDAAALQVSDLRVVQAQHV